MKVVVIGGGVSGLTTALVLLRDGHAVTIWTADPAQATTSSVAAAMWYPYKADPPNRVLGWAARSREVFAELAADGAAPVWIAEGLEVGREPMPQPWWAPAGPDLHHANPAELPPGIVDALVMRVPVLHTPRYLDWLLARIDAAGGRVVRRRVASLDEAAGSAEVVVNCAGLGARELVGDDRLVPIRGQVVRTTNPGLERFLLDDFNPEGVTYVIPRGDDVVCGGTAQEGRSDLESDPADAAAIMARCTALEPRLAAATILEHRVGLRPGRHAVRLEAEMMGAARCVHNYGHGGAGVTLSWGCAEEVAGLL